MMLKRTVYSYFYYLCCCIAFLVPCTRGIASNAFYDAIMDRQSVYSLVLSVREFATRQQGPHNQTNPESKVPCYIQVNNSDSADLYRKATSAGDCILRISGDYLIDKPLILSTRVEAEERPEVSDEYEGDLFIPVMPKPRHPLNRDIALFTPLAVSNSHAVVPAAVFTIDDPLKESFLVLLFDASLSGVGIKTEHGAVHESGCLLSGLYSQGMLQGEDNPAYVPHA